MIRYAEVYDGRVFSLGEADFMLLFAKAFKAVNIANYEGNIEDSCVFIDISDVFGTYF